MAEKDTTIDGVPAWIPCSNDSRLEREWYDLTFKSQRFFVHLSKTCANSM